MNNKEVTLYKPVEDQKTGVTREEFEQLLEIVGQLTNKVETLEKENQELKRIQTIYQKENDELRTQNFHLNMKFTILGIQLNWFELSSSEYQEYSTEQIQKYNQKYHFNSDLFQKQKKTIEKKTQKERFEILQNYFQENPNNKLSVNAVIDLVKVSRNTARKDMFHLVEQHPEQYEVVNNVVVRKHKNQRSQTKKVFSIQRKGNSL